MRHTVKLPKLSETVDEMIVIEWLVEPGDTIAAGQALMIVETDKVTVEVPSPVGGTLVQQLVAEDDEVDAGAGIAVIDTA